MKTCTRCLALKPLTDFHTHSKRPDGRQYWCKACMKEVDRLRRQSPETKTRIRETSAAWRANNSDKIREYNQRHAPSQEKYRQANKDKRNAKQKVGRYIKAGKLIRQPCEVCGMPDAEAHHDSYAPEHWLDVRWLCRAHHKEHHRLLKSE